ncbi:hypothetical protein NMY22_g12678 [Coprinellus aureogranulatus]|nr:hypothetical protein NMY22_g12678 [Coprinellus aureogranulatus]
MAFPRAFEAGAAFAILVIEPQPHFRFAFLQLNGLARWDDAIVLQFLHALAPTLYTTFNAQTPPANETRCCSKHHGHHRSLSSNANTLINAGEQPATLQDNMNDGGGRTLSPPPPPSAYTRPESGRKGNHRAKPSSFSMASTLTDAHPPIPLTRHDRSKSGSSILKTREDPQSLPTPVTAGGKHNTDGNAPSQLQEKEHTCCGVVQESVERAREDRYGPDAGRKPQPWIVLKLAVAISLGLIGYAGYVYIGILVVPMLKEQHDAQGTRREGIGLMVGFGILYLWLVWAYYKIVTTSPGYARDYVPHTPRPAGLSGSGIGSPSPRPSQTLSHQHRPSQDSRYTFNQINDLDRNGRPNNIAGPSYEQLSEMYAATPTAPDNDASGLQRSLSTGSRHMQTQSDYHFSNTLTIPKPELVGRTTSTMTVKSMALSAASKRSAALKYDEGEMISGSPLRERDNDDDVQWESEEGTTVRDSKFDRDDDRRRGTRTVAGESQASLSLKEILGENGAAARSGAGGEPDLEAGVVDSAVAGTIGKTAGMKQKGVSESPLKWLLCCFWWLASDDEDEDGRKAGRGKLKPAKPRAYIRRSPPSTAVLDPFHRYCEKDGFVKPYRAHHCRSCGTCVLRYDHHCPWIGQCVGARNHKFFINFCEAAVVFCVYTIGSMIPYTQKGFNDPRLSMNAQQIVVIALSGIFGLFTFTLLASHVYMTLQGQTTVENMQIQTLKERESETLSRAYRWYEVREKLKTLKEWDREWGEWSTEGHIWWIGPKRREWEAVMGTNPVGWILPIGKSPSDGLDYPVNPRFDPVTGRRRRREDWPEELR